MDLAIDEVTTISSIIQEEAGDDAEIIFGAVHDAELDGQIRVTVIATGFDSGEDEKVIPGDFRRARPQPQPIVTAAKEPAVTDIARVQEDAVGVRAVAGGRGEAVLPLTRYPERTVSREQIAGLDIPTFIRRQMD